MADNLTSSFKKIGYFVAAIGGGMVLAFILNIILNYVGLNVVPTLGLGNNTSNASSIAGIVYGYITTGTTGIQTILGLYSLAAGIGSLAILLDMLGVKILDRFNISLNNLVSLSKQVAKVLGYYTAAIFTFAIVRIIVGYIANIATTSFFTTTPTSITSLNTLIGTIFTSLFAMLSVAVGLLTLKFVMEAFGYEFEFMSSNGRKGDYS